MVGRRLYTVETYVRVVDREPSAEPGATLTVASSSTTNPGIAPLKR